MTRAARLDPDEARLRAAIMALRPTTYHPLQTPGSPLVDVANRWDATVTGTPTAIHAPAPIERGVTFSGTGQYALTSTSVPTPASSFSAMALFRTTDTAATSRVILSRAAAAQFSWRLLIGSTHLVSVSAFQSNGAQHATQALVGAVNTGRWFLIAGTFDGTTLYVYRGAPEGLTSNLATALTGTWHKASTAGIGIAHQDTAGLFPGSVAHAAYWADRVLTFADLAYLNSLVHGR